MKRAKLTAWFWGDVAPVRVGWYEYSPFAVYLGTDRLYWNGIHWIDLRDGTHWIWRNHELDQWRGLTRSKGRK